MENFIGCIIYLGILGILAHVVGEAIPRRWIDSQRAPFSCRAWEEGGKVYERIHIRTWKDHLPDMSRVLKKMVPKRLTSGMTVSDVERLIEETCVAELIHGMLILLSLLCMNIWPGMGGIVVTLLFAIGNIPFIIIQRYNRPKLKKLLERLKRRKHKPENAEAPRCACENLV